MGVHNTDTQVKHWDLKKTFLKCEWSKVILLCEELIDELSESEKSYHVRALYKEKNFKRCLDLCSKYIPLDTRFTALFLRFQLRSAMALELDNFIDESIEQFRLKFPLDIEPKMADMKVNYIKGNFKQSLILANDILSTDIKNFTALVYKARNLTKNSRDLNLCKSAWISVLSSSENNLEAMNQLARIAINQDNLINAEDYIQMVLKVNPDYLPAIKSNKLLLSKKIDGTKPSLKEKPYRKLFSQSKYEVVIRVLGGLENFGNLSEDETLFMLRSHNKLKKYAKTLELFDKTNRKSSSSILNEALFASENLNKKKTYRNLLKQMAVLSRKDERSMNIYLRNLIYSKSDNTYISDEIKELLSMYGQNNLNMIITYILKSGKYDIIEGIGIGDNYSSILDPIQGSLKFVLTNSEYQEIWSKLNHKIIHALSREKNKKKYTNNSFQNIFMSKTQYPLLKFYQIDGNIQPIFEKEKSKSEVDMDEILISLKKYSFDFNYELLNKDLIMLFSPVSEDKKLIKNYDYMYRINIFQKNDRLIYAEKYSVIDDYEKLLYEEKISSDPRINIGRAFSDLKYFDSISLLKISLSMQYINDSLPNIIYLNSTQFFVKIAAILLGYPKEKIIEINI
tara:strand:+ start:2931 stop:4802 length:1872 start_codon:yes stop_codon:yes gene_type:complete